MTTKQNIEETTQRILDDGAIVAIRLADGRALLDVCRALRDGGLSVLEITLTTPGALDAIREMATDERVLVGGGTVLTKEDVRAVAEAGGRFVLSPLFNPEVLDEAASAGLLAIPGASTPSEIHAAHEHGSRFVKVFPAAPLGGARYIQLVRGPLPNIPIIPTSGPTAETLGEYLSAGAVAVGVGGGEFFEEGYTTESVTNGARRVRAAIDAWRAANR